MKDFAASYPDPDHEIDDQTMAPASVCLMGEDKIQKVAELGEGGGGDQIRIPPAWSLNPGFLEIHGISPRIAALYLDRVSPCFCPDSLHATCAN
jgi:hypothetical protein